MNLENILIVAAIIFSIGLYGALSKRNAITVLMSLELMFNAVNITAVAMQNRHRRQHPATETPGGAAALSRARAEPYSCSRSPIAGLLFFHERVAVVGRW